MFLGGTKIISGLSFKIYKLMQDILARGPNESSERKLEQLKMHERLHNRYDKGDLKPCILSYYLRKIKPLRDAMIKSLLGEHVSEEELSMIQLPTGLEQIPIGMAVLADRGFA